MFYCYVTARNDVTLGVIPWFGLLSPVAEAPVTRPGHRVVNITEQVYNRLDEIRREIARVHGGHPSINDAVMLLLSVYDKYVKAYGDSSSIVMPKPIEHKPVLEVKPISVDLKSNDDDYVKKYVEDLRKRLGLA